MSVASRNPFALLDDDGPAPTPTSAPAPQAAAGAKRVIPGAQGAAPTRGAPRGPARGGKTGAPRGAAGPEDAEALQQKDVRGDRGDRAPRGARGARGGRGGPRGRGRPFDRHSQTDRIDTEKNLHQGWGGDDGKRELAAEENAVADAAAEQKAADVVAATAPNGDVAAVTPAPIVEEEEVDNTKTYDDYLAEKAAKKLQLGTAKEERKPETDGAALGQQVVNKEDDFWAASQKESARRTREKKEKHILEIEQTFSQPATAGRDGERGGRGGARGGRGRGAERGSFRGERGARGGGRGGPRGGAAPNRGGPRGGTRGGAAGVNLTDESAFPSLG